MRDRHSRHHLPENDQPPLRRHIVQAQKALKNALGHADWFLVGDDSDAPEVGALLDEATTAIYYAREELVRLMGRLPRASVQMELTLLADLELDIPDGPRPGVAPCGNCGHATRDHAEGLTCLICRCTDYTLGEGR
ncbi:hypothetical protein [Actinomadura opuntiae]|uniref:hypothetical protein n=1 Tax=Actinomadura sp. OS1-43 TaxID=604315 RepID=UPI00255AB60F|nr:hypothetical protein [Actinomadura sp. OS1-43]MDL4815968.1 hypothetical protein [Actinomadura sp. OS1-43]